MVCITCGRQVSRPRIARTALVHTVVQRHRTEVLEGRAAPQRRPAAVGGGNATHGDPETHCPLETWPGGGHGDITPPAY